MTLRPIRATPDSVSRFGMLAGAPAGAPTSEGPDYRFWSDMAHYAIEGETEIGVCTVFRQPGNSVGTVERHRATPEILIPIDAPFLVPLLLEGEHPSAMQVFQVNLGEAIVINPGVWHGACLPAEGDTSSYFVIFRRGTPRMDVEKTQFDPVGIAIDR
ncbi:MAG: ureidoglycolate lyase [Bacteroidetes bacterium]|nr:ureidoglycolate lyase [Bacteroidota bacterium]